MKTLMRKIIINDVGPRDGLQNQDVYVDVAQRVALINMLLDAGVSNIEVASFVSPKAVPQMDGARDIVLATKDNSAQLSVLVPNMRGYNDALAAGVKIISVVPSATETMNSKNINMGLNETLNMSCDILRRATTDGVRAQAYISVAFECPYEGPVAPTQVGKIAAQLVDAGAVELIIADTIGAANPQQVSTLFNILTDTYATSMLSAHFHDTRAMALANVYAAMQCGINKYDASIGGLGGCPFASGAAGNLATEDLVSMVHQMGYDTGTDLLKLLEASAFAGNLVGHPVGGRMQTWFKTSMQEAC